MTSTSTSDTGRKSVLVFLGHVAGAALGYVALLLIGRYVEPAAFGSHVFALSLIGFFALVANLGLPKAHVHFVAVGEDLGAAIGVFARVRVALLALLVVMVGVAVAVWVGVLGKSFTNATSLGVIAMALAYHVTSDLRDIAFQTWNGQSRVNRVEIAKLLDTILSVALLAIAALVISHAAGRPTILPGAAEFLLRLLPVQAPISIAGGALLITGAYVAAKLVSTLLVMAWWMADRTPFGAWDAALASRYWHYALPLALNDVLYLVLRYTDSILLGYFWTSAEVGLYGAAQKLSNLAIIASLSVAVLLFPRFSNLHAAGRREQALKTFRKAERYLLLLVVPIAAGMIAFPREALHIAVGDRYLGAAAALQWLAGWAIFSTMARPLRLKFMGAKMLRVALISSVITAGANVLLNVVLIPTHIMGVQLAGLGLTGAAMATCLSTGAGYVYVRVQAGRAFGIPWTDRTQLRFLFAGTLLAVAWITARNALPATAFDRVWELAGWGAAGTLAYVGILFMLGELKRRDAAFILNIVHPGHLLAELKGRK